jgi:hypothetical protein
MKYIRQSEYEIGETACGARVHDHRHQPSARDDGGRHSMLKGSFDNHRVYYMSPVRLNLVLEVRCRPIWHMSNT